MSATVPWHQRRNPVTGRYTPTARNLAFRKAAQERRADNAEIAAKQREVTKAKLDAVIARAEAATAVAQAAKRAAQEHAQPTESATVPETPADEDNGAQDSTAD